MFELIFLLVVFSVAALAGGFYIFFGIHAMQEDDRAMGIIFLGSAVMSTIGLAILVLVSSSPWLFATCGLLSTAAGGLLARRILNE